MIWSSKACTEKADKHDTHWNIAVNFYCYCPHSEGPGESVKHHILMECKAVESSWAWPPFEVWERWGTIKFYLHLPKMRHLETGQIFSCALYSVTQFYNEDNQHCLDLHFCMYLKQTHLLEHIQIQINWGITITVNWIFFPCVFFSFNTCKLLHSLLNMPRHENVLCSCIKKIKLNHSLIHPLTMYKFKGAKIKRG